MLLTAEHRNCKMWILKQCATINFTIYLNASAKYSEVKVEVTQTCFMCLLHTNYIKKIHNGSKTIIHTKSKAEPPPRYSIIIHSFVPWWHAYTESTQLSTSAWTRESILRGYRVHLNMVTFYSLQQMLMSILFVLAWPNFWWSNLRHVQVCFLYNWCHTMPLKHHSLLE